MKGGARTRILTAFRKPPVNLDIDLENRKR
jgi:hypothetical protein